MRTRSSARETKSGWALTVVLPSQAQWVRSRDVTLGLGVPRSASSWVSRGEATPAGGHTHHDLGLACPPESPGDPDLDSSLTGGGSTYCTEQPGNVKSTALCCSKIMKVD